MSYIVTFEVESDIPLPDVIRKFENLRYDLYDPEMTLMDHFSFIRNINFLAGRDSSYKGF